MRRALRLTVVAAVMAGTGAVAALADHDHEHEDILVARTAADNLVAHFGHDNEGFAEEHSLAPVSGGLLEGWLGDAPGFGHMEEDHADEDLYMLAEGAEVYFEIIALDEGLRVFTPGFGSELMAGDTHLLGDEHLHAHLEWFIDATVPGVDPENNSYGVTFRFTDGSTAPGYGPSPSYTLSFVPEPTAAVCAALGLLVLRRR